MVYKAFHSLLTVEKLLTEVESTVNVAVIYGGYSKISTEWLQSLL